jgi:tetratricopeptide (TPR) repeat protein
MHASSEQSFVSPVLIGRAGQLDNLTRLLQGLHAGPRSVVISGEAGIGKSRLVQEAASAAASHGLQTLQGTCFEHDSRLPFSAVLDLIRTSLLHRSGAELQGQLGNLGCEIVKLTPELGLLCPEFVPTPPLDPAQEKRRLFQALSLVFEQMAVLKPMFLVFEDLHWADETTLEFLLQHARRVASSPHGQRIVLVLTYRTEEAGPALVHLLAELDRMRIVTELRLDQLTRAETDVMVRAILHLHRPVGREFLEHLYRLTDGNPFFIEEVLKAAQTRADSNHLEAELDRQPLDLPNVPRTVQDAVGQRSQDLSTPAREVLDLAAVSGQRFDLDLLQAATGLEVDVLLDRIKELIEAQLVVEESAGRFRFRHALTREAVYLQLLASERRTRHRVLGETLERLTGSSTEETALHLGDLAHHFYEAEAWEKALEYCEQAGQKAEELFTPTACVEYLSHALDAAVRLGGAASPAILRQRAKAYELVGDFERARTDLEAALRGAQARDDRLGAWEALIGLGLLWLARDYHQAGKYLEEALQLARAIDDQRLAAHSLNRVGNWLMNVGDPPGALARHEEALAAFRTLGDRAGTAETLDLLGMTSFHLVNVKNQITYYQEAIALFRELDQRMGLASSLSVMAFTSTNYEWAVPVAERADFDAAVAAGEEAIQVAREIGWRAGEAFACYALGMALGAGGRYDRALPLAHESLSIAEEIEHTQWIVAALRLQGELELDLLQLDRARDRFAKGLELAKAINSSFWEGGLSAGLSRAAIQNGDLKLASTLLAPFGLDPPDVLSAWVTGCARAELALAQRDFAGTINLVDALELRAWPDGCPSRLTLLRAEALQGLARFAEAEATLDQLLHQPDRFVPLPLRWRAQVLRGRLLRAQGRRSEARDVVQAARSTIAEIAETIGDEELRQAFMSQAAARLPRPQPPSVRAAAKAQFDGLTEREREVASLIALGQSNREIAATLVLSERTVAVHVANVLGKLGFASRTRIASWATERGLIPPTR